MSTQARFLSLILLSLGSASLAAEPARDRFGDPLPDGAVARLGSLHLRNEQAIFTVAFAADGKTLIACDANFLSYWDPATGKRVRREALKNPAGVRLRRFSADGKTLIQSGHDNVVRFMDTATGAEQSTLNYAQCSFIQALDVSRDGKVLAAIHRASIALWNVANGKLLHEFKGAPIVPLAPNQLIALTADGKQLVLAHSDSSLHVVDVASGKEVRAIEMPPLPPGRHPSQRVQRLALSPDGRYLVYGGSATPLTVCDLATGKRLRELAPAPGILSGLAFTPNGRFLAVDEFTRIRLIGVLSGKEIRKLPALPGANSTLAFSPDGRTLAAARGSHTISLWDVATDRQPHPIVGHEAAIQSIVFFPDGKRLVSADYNRGMIVWDIASSRDLARRENSTPSQSVAVDDDGNAVQFVGYDVAVHRWDLRTGREERQQVLAGLPTNQLALSPDGRSMAIVTAGRTRQLQLFDLKNNKSAVLQTLPAQGWVSQTVFAPDSRRLAMISQDSGLRLWDRDTGKLVREFKTETPGREPRYPAFAADGRCLALFDGALRIREIASGGDRLQIPMTTTTLFALAFSPDSRFLACGQSDGSLVVYGAVSGKQLARWQGKQGMVRSLAFSRDGRLLASGGENGTILIWKVPDGEDLPATLGAEEALTFWQTLADDDAARASHALAGLAAAPAQALPLIKERFRATGKPPTPERLARLIAELDDAAFKVRQRASRELSEAGPDAAGALRKALANDPSTETRRRIETLLNRLNKGGDPERLRGLRAIEVLERIGTPQARVALRELAEKDIDAALREEVRASLRRLDQRR
ncbi:MAG TPA: PQQ-binding-like beta-propeller repeat protein [Gemmataceae bacterium]|jgi:WD40 repeat protein